MRYWRHYPRFLQVILLMLMIFTLASFSTVIAGVLMKPFLGISLEDIVSLNASSSDRLVHAAQLLQGLTSLFTFLLSALLFAYLTHPEPLGYLGLRKPGNKQQILLTILLFIAFVPLANQLSTWIQHINLGQGAKLQYIRNEMMTRTMMRGTGTGDLFLHFLLFALIPAFGEELLFRGVLMRFSYHNSRNIHFAVLFSSAIFALAHGSAYNFLPIMLMGVVLGYIYYLSGSVWPGILAHFINNALAVTGLFLQNRKIVPEEVGAGENFPWYVLLICIVAFAYLFFLLYRKATPLPYNWSDDFAVPETT